MHSSRVRRRILNDCRYRKVEKQMATASGRHLPEERGALECLDGGGQATLEARRLVLVNDFLVGDGVDGAHRFAEHLLRGGLVARGNRLAHLLDGGAQFGALAEIACAVLERLAGTLAGLGGIGHVNEMNAWKAVDFMRFPDGMQARRRIGKADTIAA